MAIHLPVGILVSRNVPLLCAHSTIRNRCNVPAQSIIKCIRYGKKWISKRWRKNRRRRSIVQFHNSFYYCALKIKAQQTSSTGAPQTQSRFASKIITWTQNLHSVNNRKLSVKNETNRKTKRRKKKNILCYRINYNGTHIFSWVQEEKSFSIKQRTVERSTEHSRIV